MIVHYTTVRSSLAHFTANKHITWPYSFLPHPYLADLSLSAASTMCQDGLELVRVCIDLA